MPRRVRFSVAAVAVLLTAALVVGACGSDPKGTSAKDIKQLPKGFVTGTYLGLTPHRENVKSDLDNQDANAYITAVGLYSLRKGDLLEATLQVSQLSDKARPKSKAFQEQVADQIGGTKVQAFVMGDRFVYRSSQRKQSLTSWFDGRYFLILAVRDSYKTPRALLRELVTKVHFA